MSKIYKNILDVVGKTPLVELCKYEKKKELLATLIAKVEAQNPGGSVKDRAALSMIKDAKKRGVLKKNGTIIEPTSGNTGIAIGMVAAVMGYRTIFTMPDSMSLERRKMLKMYGAEIVLTPGSEGMTGAIQKAKALQAEIPDAIILSQFTNEANVNAHRKTTGPEIWVDMGGRIDFFIATVGTGGTLMGAASYLKEMNPSIKIVAVEPVDSPVLSGGKAGPHKIQGIGAGFIPEILDPSIIDEIIQVSNSEAMDTFKELVLEEGIFAGISSGAALYAATLLAKRKENEGKRMVVILPDSGDRYLSLVD